MFVGEGLWCNEAVQAGIESRVLQAVTCDKCEQAIEGQHAFKPALVQGVTQEVGQQQGTAHGWQHIRVHLQQHLCVCGGGRVCRMRAGGEGARG